MVDLFPPLLDKLLGLLSALTPDHWNRAVARSTWTVKDIALHLFGGDVGILSGKRDGLIASSTPFKTWGERVAWLNARNELWVSATRRISPRLLTDLLRFTGLQVCDFFASLDPFALGGPVSWAGPEPAPVWRDLAREYSERWYHQAQIREAVGAPPLLDAFARARPHTTET